MSRAGRPTATPTGSRPSSSGATARRRPLAAALPAAGESRFAVFYVDQEVILLRGSFPQASRIGWHPTKDAVAMLPHSPPCAEVANEGAAEMKLHGAGFPAFTLSGSRSHCAIPRLRRPPELNPVQPVRLSQSAMATAAGVRPAWDGKP